MEASVDKDILLLMAKIRMDNGIYFSDNCLRLPTSQNLETILSRSGRKQIYVNTLFNTNGNFINIPENRMKLSQVLQYKDSAPTIAAYSKITEAKDKEDSEYILELRTFSSDLENVDKNFLLRGSFKNLSKVTDMIAKTALEMDAKIVDRIYEKILAKCNKEIASGSPAPISDSLWPCFLKANFNGYKNNYLKTPNFILNDVISIYDVEENFPCIIIENPFEKEDKTALNTFLSPDDKYKLPVLTHIARSNNGQYILFFHKDKIKEEKEPEKPYLERDCNSSCVVLVREYNLDYFAIKYSHYFWERDIDIPKKEIEKAENTIEKDLADYCEYQNGIYFNAIDEFGDSNNFNREFIFDNICILQVDSKTTRYFDMSKEPAEEIDESDFLLNDDYSTIRFNLSHCQNILREGKKEIDSLKNIISYENDDKEER